MAINTGWKDASTASNSYAYSSFDNVNNVKTEDSVYASKQLWQNGGMWGQGFLSDFGFSVPSGTRITKIYTRFLSKADMKEANASFQPNYTCQLRYNGSGYGGWHNGPTTLAESTDTEVLDSWTVDYAPEVVNDSSFGIDTYGYVTIVWDGSRNITSQTDVIQLSLDYVYILTSNSRIKKASQKTLTSLSYIKKSYEAINSTGWKSAGTIANSDFTDYNNMTEEDNTPAYVSFTEGFPGASHDFNYQDATNFNFNIPVNPVGIELRVKTKVSTSDMYIPIHTAQLMLSGSTVGSSKTNDGSYYFGNTSYDYFSLGSSNDVWSASLTASDINDSTFGATLNGNTWQIISHTETVYCDVIQMKIYYPVITSDSNIIIPVQETINSYSHILLKNTFGLLSNSSIIVKKQSNLTSSSYIKKSYSETLNSDAWINLRYSENLSTNYNILKITPKNLYSNSKIKKLGYQHTYLSDSFIKKSKIKNTLTSESFIFGPYKKYQTSSSYIKKLDAEKTLTSDSWISKSMDENINMNSYLLKSYPKNLNGNSMILKSYSSTINLENYTKISGGIKIYDYGKYGGLFESYTYGLTDLTYTFNKNSNNLEILPSTPISTSTGGGIFAYSIPFDSTKLQMAYFTYDTGSGTDIETIKINMNELNAAGKKFNRSSYPNAYINFNMQIVAPVNSYTIGFGITSNEFTGDYDEGFISASIEQSTPYNTLRVYEIKAVLGEIIESNSYIILPAQENISSDSFIYRSDTHFITSDIFIKREPQENINSDSFILYSYSQDLLSNSYLKASTEQFINSDAYVLNSYSETINLLSYILKSGINTKNALSYIKKSYINTYALNSYLLKIVSSAINSDYYILQNYYNALGSSSWITGITRIYSNSYIYLEQTQNDLLSDMVIVLPNHADIYQSDNQHTLDVWGYQKNITYRRYDFDTDNMSGDLIKDTYYDYNIVAELQPSNIIQSLTFAGQLENENCLFFIPREVKFRTDKYVDYNDYFTGTTLDSRWIQYRGFSGVISVYDNYLHMLTRKTQGHGPEDPAYIFTKLDFNNEFIADLEVGEIPETDIDRTFGWVLSETVFELEKLFTSHFALQFVTSGNKSFAQYFNFADGIYLTIGEYDRKFLYYRMYFNNNILHFYGSDDKVQWTELFNYENDGELMNYIGINHSPSGPYGDAISDIYDWKIANVRIQQDKNHELIPARFRPQINDEILCDGIWYRIDAIHPKIVGESEIGFDCLVKRIKNINDEGWN